VTKEISTSCAIAGGGPAGIMIGYLLARVGVPVVVLEQHADFLRDFRGDTIHPSTMDVVAELGLLHEFLRRPHQKVNYAEGELGNRRLRFADFTHLPTRCKFIAFMPQWEFLDFIAGHALQLPTFELLMNTEATGLLTDASRVAGLHARGPEGPVEIHSDLVIGADGRRSRLREAAGLEVLNLGAPMDVLWFRLGRGTEGRHLVLGRIEAGQAMVMLDRGDYWQCALIIRKGTFDDVRRQGIDVFRSRIAKLAGRESADDIASFDDVKLLTVAVDRLETWYRPGLLFIGDAAHAMSPAGGVGINLAIQDAVAAANILAEPLLSHSISVDDLWRVQRRRMFPTRVTQALQVALQNRVIDPVLAAGRTPAVPGIVKLMQRWTWLQRIPARAIGVGIRPEHVRVPRAPRV
jgi:2-polyprenyl-6-methoxyphenol hydroxylase-like FAD-dependent oxidoreductase